LAGGFPLAAAIWAGTERLAESFRTGRGIGWGEQDQRLFGAVDRCFAALYRTSLVSEWLPALDGVVERLTTGARVLDVGCGLGSSARLIAAAFPHSTVLGIDPHAGSIRAAERAAAEHGLADRVRFAVGTAVDYPVRDWDLICFFDALHDMGDPVGAARYARSAVAADGTVLFVEPAAGDRVEDNLHPIGLAYYTASTALCVPGSLAQHGGAALGALAGGQRLTAVLTEAGFSRVRIALRGDFNLVIEARP
jgi:SAM-dependent methyltransferase